MNNRAFSLVELSIVLVILGLLTGGVLTGQSLIRASELRSVTTDYQRYIAAVQAFRDKYFAIPGDMSNATSFWGKDNTNCTTHTGTAATPGTCNGNGNGQLATATAVSTTGEMFRFWQQLALAGLVEGSYTGQAGAAGTGYEALIGTNVPRSKISNAGWTAYWYIGPYAGDTFLYALDYGQPLAFGATVVGNATINPALKPEEAWNIDTKMDDGKPARGNVIAAWWNNACAAADDGTHANNDLVASYKLTDTTQQCALLFVKAY